MLNRTTHIYTLNEEDMYALLFTVLLWFSTCFSMEKAQDMPAVHADMARELADRFLKAPNAEAIAQIVSAYEPEKWLPAFLVFGNCDPLLDRTGDFYVKLSVLIKKIGEEKLLTKLSSDKKPDYVGVIRSFKIAVDAKEEAKYRKVLDEAREQEQKQERERIQQEEQRKQEGVRKEQERIQREQDRKQEAERRDLAETLKRSLTAQRRSTEVSLNQAEALANVILKDDRSLEDVQETLANGEISLWVLCFTLYSKMMPEHDLTGLYYEKLDWLIQAIHEKKQKMDQTQYRQFEDLRMRMLQGAARAQREQEYAENLERIKSDKEEARKDAEARLAAEAKRGQEERQKFEARKIQQKAEEEEARRKKEEEKSGTKGQDEALQRKLAERLAKAEAGKMVPLAGQDSTW